MAEQTLTILAPGDAGYQEYTDLIAVKPGPDPHMKFCGVWVRHGTERSLVLRELHRARCAPSSSSPWMMVVCPHGRQIEWWRPGDMPEESTHMPGCQHDCWAIRYEDA